MPQCRHESDGKGRCSNAGRLDSFVPGDVSYWEHGFGGYELKPQWGETAEEIATRKANWNKALEIVGDSVVLATKDGPVHALEQKGYDPLEVPETVVRAAEEYGCNTPAKILSADELDGRESFAPSPDAFRER